VHQPDFTALALNGDQSLYS